MKIQKAFLIFLFALLLPFNSAAQLSQLVEQTDKSVFTIYTYDEYGQASGTGTGFFIDSTGVAITNFHVLDGASMATVRTTEGSTYQITDIIGSSRKHDLVKFRVDTEDSQVSGLQLSKVQPEKGESIFTIGAPRGLSNTVSKGIVSGIRDDPEMGQVFQITAPISPGSSGSPVINMSGQVVGIATFQYQDGQNLNFAVSAKHHVGLDRTTVDLENVSSSSRYYFINEKSNTDRYLILNSIKRKGDELTINFTWMNLIIGYGEKMFIWVNTENRNETMYVKDVLNNKKYYASSSTLGVSRFNPTRVPVGEAVEFQVSFSGVPKSVRKVKIGEGTGSWKFDPIVLDSTRLPDSKNFVTSIVGNKVASGKKEEVRNFLSDLSNSDVPDADIYNALGVIEFNEGDYRAALDYFDQAIKREPSVSIFYFNKYRVFEEMGNTRDAIGEISDAINRDPSHGDYYQYKASAHMKLKQWHKAIKSFDNVIERIDPSPSIYLYRGDAYAQIGNRSAACSDWRRAREKNRETRNRTSGSSVNNVESATTKRISKYCE